MSRAIRDHLSEAVSYHRKQLHYEPEVIPNGHLAPTRSVLTQAINGPSLAERSRDDVMNQTNTYLVCQVECDCNYCEILLFIAG